MPRNRSKKRLSKAERRRQIRQQRLTKIGVALACSCCLIAVVMLPLLDSIRSADHPSSATVADIWYVESGSMQIAAAEATATPVPTVTPTPLPTAEPTAAPLVVPHFEPIEEIPEDVVVEPVEDLFFEEVPAAAIEEATAEPTAEITPLPTAQPGFAADLMDVSIVRSVG